MIYFATMGDQVIHRDMGRWSVRRVTRLGFLAAVGTALFVLESFVPLPLPFLKIGLANISTLLALLISGPADAIAVVFLRIVTGSLLTGSFLGPSFILAISAGLVSAAVMCIFRMLLPSLFGPVGLSLAGSTAHVLTQLEIVAFVYVRNEALFHLLPLLLLTALVGGLVVGIITAKLLPALNPANTSQNGKGRYLLSELGPWDKAVTLLLMAAIVSSFVVVPDSAGSTVLIEVDGKTVGKLSLQENAQLTVQGTRGSLLIETRDGKVRVKVADCPNRICVHTGWKSRGGDVIVCIPNKTLVRILDGDAGTVKGITG